MSDTETTEGETTDVTETETSESPSESLDPDVESSSAVETLDCESEETNRSGSENSENKPRRRTCLMIFIFVGIVAVFIVASILFISSVFISLATQDVTSLHASRTYDVYCGVLDEVYPTPDGDEHRIWCTCDLKFKNCVEEDAIANYNVHDCTFYTNSDSVVGTGAVCKVDLNYVFEWDTYRGCVQDSVICIGRVAY